MVTIILEFVGNEVGFYGVYNVDMDYYSSYSNSSYAAITITDFDLIFLGVVFNEMWNLIWM